MSAHRIKDIQISKAVSTISKPIADSTHTISHISFLVCRIRTAAGTMGEGYLLSFHYSPQGIAGAVYDTLPLLDGLQTWETGEFLQRAETEGEYFGFTGLQKQAAALVNVAMWDAWSRALDVPIWKLFGTTTKRVPVYGSGGWLSYSIEELIDEVTDYTGRGFTAVKIKVGSPDTATDVERVARVREAVGNGVKIMIDANQGCDLPGALKLAEELRRYNVHWFEEPVDHSDFAGFQTLRARTGISIAMGEREYDTVALRELINLQAIDLWQPDLIRIGGVEAWRASAALAEAHNIPVLPHYYRDYDVPLLCTVKNPYGAESFDWIDGIIDTPMKIEQGWAYPREGAGWGFRFRDDSLEELFHAEY